MVRITTSFIFASVLLAYALVWRVMRAASQAWRRSKAAQNAIFPKTCQATQ